MIANKIKPELGSKKVKDLTRQDVKRFHRKITLGQLPGQRKPAPYHANRVLALLRKMLSLAVGWEIRPDNPAKGVKPNPEQARATFLDNEDIKRLCQAACKHPNRQSADALMLLLLTGCRRGEVLGAEWSEIDLKSGWWEIPLERKKSKRPHRVKMSEPALAILRERKKVAKGRYVFPAPNGDGPQKDMRSFFRAVCEQAGLIGLRVHDIRHSVASILFNSGATYAQIGQVLGHSTPQMTMRYSHMFDQTQSELADQVGQVVTAAINGD
jgi:integrase